MATGSPKNVIERYLATLYEAEQIVDGVARDSSATPAEQSAVPIYRDMREDMIRASNLRNDIEVFKFEPDQLGFGTGSAKIVSVRLLAQAEIGRASCRESVWQYGYIWGVAAL